MRNYLLGVQQEKGFKMGDSRLYRSVGRYIDVGSWLHAFVPIQPYEQVQP